MLFFRRFIHDLLPSILIGLAVLVFCLFSFASGSSSLTQAQILSSSGYEEMFYSAQPYVEVSTGNKKDTFADFGGLTVYKAGRYSVSSDLYMILPGYSYTEVLPFADPKIGTLQKGECLVAKNVMAMRHLNIGDTLMPGDNEASPLKIVGELAPIKGFAHDYYGVVVFGHDPYLQSLMNTSAPRYASFVPSRVEDFGQIQVLFGSVQPKAKLIDKANREAVPRIIGAYLTTLIAPLAVALLYHRDERRRKANVIASGASKWATLRYFLLYKLLTVFLPVFVVATIFLLTNLVYLSGSLIIFGSLTLVALLVTILESALLTRRS